MKNFKYLILVLIVLITALFQGALHAEHSKLHINVMGLDIYLVVIPAEVLNTHSQTHINSKMHSQNKMDSGGQFHLAVSVIEAKTQRRVQDMELKARIITEKNQGPKKLLEGMLMSGQLVYGNFFFIPGDDVYQVEVTIQHKSKRDALIVVFDRSWE